MVHSFVPWNQISLHDVSANHSLLKESTILIWEATSQLVTRLSPHTVNSSPVNSSHTRLITKSTRHKRAHNKTTSTSRNYLHAVRRHPETVLNTDCVITAICVTLMYTADYRSRRQITLLQKARSTRHNAVKHDGQLVTRFYGVTSWLVPIWDFHSFPWSAATNTCYVSYYFACRETHVLAIADVLWYVEVEKILCNAWMTVKKPA